MTTRTSLTDLLFDATTDAAQQLIDALQNNETEQEVARLNLVLTINMKAFQQAMGEAAPTQQVWVRRNPKYTNMRFLLARELAHLFLAHHHLPQSEYTADELARVCCGHGAGLADD